MTIERYTPPFLFGNGHIQTIFPTLFRKLNTENYKRERIDTPDTDFIDLDWSLAEGKSLAVLSHGLEGNSERAYIAGMARALNRNGWDALAWNYRTCGGEMNRLARMYHNGATDDLDTIIRHSLKQKRYAKIVLIGFSMGGNLGLLYLGEKGRKLSPRIAGAVTFSVPCDLEASAVALKKPSNKIYMMRFLRMLHEKIKEKKKEFPDIFDDRDYHKIKDFKQFDDRYTAPIHGFRNAEDYWHRCSSLKLLHKIKVPSIIINAENDPFLEGNCYPYGAVSKNKYLKLEVPKSGGHVGFIEFNKEGLYWSEKRAIFFINQL